MRTRPRVAGILAIAVLAIALPASAQVPPGMTAPTNPPPVGPGAGPATGTGNAGADPMERRGPFFSVGLDAAPQGVLIGDLQLGWMIAPWIGVFVSLDGVVAEEAAAHLWGAGLRLASGVAFAEVRIMSLSNDGECDEGCGDTPHVALIGAGVELIRSQHVALDLHLHVLTDGRDTVPLAGLGLGFYF
jgi:hypothetical protein